MMKALRKAVEYLKYLGFHRLQSKPPRRTPKSWKQWMEKLSWTWQASKSKNSVLHICFNHLVTIFSLFLLICSFLLPFPDASWNIFISQLSQVRENTQTPPHNRKKRSNIVTSIINSKTTIFSTRIFFLSKGLQCSQSCILVLHGLSRSIIHLESDQSWLQSKFCFRAQLVVTTKEEKLCNNNGKCNLICAFYLRCTEFSYFLTLLRQNPPTKLHIDMRNPLTADKTQISPLKVSENSS